MEADTEEPPLALASDLPPPELTTGAARVLLRILRKEHDRQLATQSGRSLTAEEVIAS